MTFPSGGRHSFDPRALPTAHAHGASRREPDRVADRGVGGRAACRASDAEQAGATAAGARPAPESVGRTRPLPDHTVASPDVRQGRGVIATWDRFELDDDPGRVDRDAVWRYLSTEAYWGRWRRRDQLEAQLDGAWRVVGAYDPSGATVGFGRAVSDGVGFAYLADVYVEASVRGRGLGVALVRFMIDDGPGRTFRWTLHTRDAHSLYTRFGFAVPDETFLERPGAQPPMTP
jgi:GNAT superfamily N-acetyltransferase